MHKKYLDGKILVKVYNRSFSSSTHNYNLQKYSLEEVTKNHNLVTSDIGSKKLITLNQVHGVDYVYADNDLEYPYDADAMYTSESQITLGIQTADCVPVLFFNKEGAKIAAAHLGWKSALHGLIDEICIDKSLDFAVIGPAISQDSYEVDSDYRNNFITNDYLSKEFFVFRDNKHYFDLPGFVKYKIQKYDIDIIDHFNICTYKNPDIFPSNRFSFHKGRKYKGSILSTITIMK